MCASSRYQSRKRNVDGQPLGHRGMADVRGLRAPFGRPGLLGGIHDVSGGGLGLARLNADGTLDTTFGNGGTELAVPATLPVLLPNAALLAVLPNGEFLAIGDGTSSTTGTGPTELVLTRYFQ